MKRIKLFLSILLFIGIVIIASKINAASITASSSKSTINVGEEFNVSINLSGASVATLTTRLTVDTSKVEYVSGPSNSSFSNGRAIYTWTDPTGGSNPKTGGTIVTFKFRAKQTGKASFQVSGEFYDPDENPITVSFSGTNVTIQQKTEVNPPTNNGTTNTPSQGGTTTPPTSPTTPNNPTTPNRPSSGTSNNQTTNNSSDNANLKNLHIDIEGMTPKFSKNTTNYYIVIQNNIDKINVTAEPEDNRAKVEITGNTNLKSGVNKIKIQVTAQDNKTKKAYIINVTKTDNPDLANANLENLAIENVTLNPEFDKDITEYKVEISSIEEKLNILAIPQIEGAQVQITGNENLQFGENIIKITVIAKDGITTKDYTINIYKKTQEEENEGLEATNNQEQLNEVEEQKNITVGEIIFIAIILIGVTGIIIYLITKYLKENKQ
ncbi:MAG: hypothetical protein HFJ53_06545 [Clostridia bacterium]|jgi:hypothetical protein|nr:hypothetical protein [Clostridia bacterium]